MKVGQYSKTIVVILASALGIFTAANADGVVSPVEWVNIGLSLLTAVGVYLIPNLPTGPGKFAKAIVAFGGAALSAVAVIVANSTNWSGVTPNDWLSVVLAGLAAIGLYVVPNTSAVSAVTVIDTATPTDVHADEQDPSSQLPETVPSSGDVDTEANRPEVVAAVKKTRTPKASAVTEEPAAPTEA